MPVIARTRISVGLVVEMERAGHSADEMVALYPHIIHVQVYDALSYYYEHKEEIEKMMDENKAVYWMEKQKVKIGENNTLYR